MQFYIFDAKQFRQIVLLPQGDFRRFLDADSNAKEDLLRDLFGTQLIQRWQTAMQAQTKQQGGRDSGSGTDAEFADVTVRI